MAQYVDASNVGAALGNRDLMSGNIKIIDVRDIDEFRDGHITGAIHKPSEKWYNVPYVDLFVQEHVLASTAQDRVVFHW